MRAAFAHAALNQGASLDPMQVFKPRHSSIQTDSESGSRQQTRAFGGSLNMA